MEDDDNLFSDIPFIEEFECELSLAEIEDEIKVLAEMAHRGIQIDEKRIDYLLKAQEHNEEYQERIEKERQNWRDSIFDFSKQCLERTRSFIPVNIFKSSLQDLVELGISEDLSKRILQRQCLWLVRMSPEEISRLHESDLLGRFNPLQQNLDIIETAAIYASLPEKFNNDKFSKKIGLRESVEENLRKMLIKNDNDELLIDEIRNPAYSGLQFGPISDVSSVRSNDIISSGCDEPRTSFIELCKQYSIVNKINKKNDNEPDSDDESEIRSSSDDEVEDDVIHTTSLSLSKLDSSHDKKPNNSQDENKNKNLGNIPNPNSNFPESDSEFESESEYGFNNSNFDQNQIQYVDSESDSDADSDSESSPSNFGGQKRMKQQLRKSLSTKY